MKKVKPNTFLGFVIIFFLFPVSFPKTIHQYICPLGLIPYGFQHMQLQ